MGTFPVPAMLMDSLLPTRHAKVQRKEVVERKEREEWLRKGAREEGNGLEEGKGRQGKGRNGCGRGGGRRMEGGKRRMGGE